MVKVDLTGVHRVRAKGREYHYAFRGGPLIWKTGSPHRIGSAEYISAFIEAKDAPPPNKDKGTFNHLIDLYMDGPEFRDKAPRTQKDYERQIKLIREKFGETPASVFNNPKIRAAVFQWRDQFKGKAADDAWGMIARIVSVSYKKGRLLHHHLKDGGRYYKPADHSEVIWLPDQVRQFNAGTPQYICNALTVMLNSGLRPGDAVKLSRFHVHPTPKGRRIEMRTGKKKRLVSIPVTEDMAKVLDSMDSSQTIVLLNSKGDPFTEETVSKAITRWRRKAGLPEYLRPYDTRGTAAYNLLNAGATLAEIALAMGWDTSDAARMIDIYAARNPDLADGILIKLEKAKREQSL